MPYRKNQYKVTVPHSSGFDKSHRYTGTGMCGTLIPVLCDEVVPGTKVRLRVPMSAQLPPLASETYMNASIKYEAFFVPMRLLCTSFESFFNDFAERVQIGGTSSSWTDFKGILPVFSLPLTVDRFGPSTLMDYLGFVTPSSSSASTAVQFSPMPLIAYHLVWQEWYRNPRVQNPAFTKTLGSVASPSDFKKASIIPYTFYHDFSGGYTENYLFDSSASFVLADGKSIFDLRQRNFGLDYFTGARTSAQQGDASAVSIAIPAGTDSAGGTTTMTIAALRAANSLQQFRERNNLASPRFVDQIQDRFGVRPSDGVAQRPICIGSATYDISTRGVDQTANNTSQSISDKNPFSSVAAQYGRGGALGNDYLVDNFEALEPGYIIVMQSLVPEATYTVGVEKMFRRYLGPGSIVDMANPLLQNVGDQPILLSELKGGDSTLDTIFGYTDRFSEFMFRKNTVHGLMRSDLGGNLRSFVLQRDFSSASIVTLSSAFLEIPTNYLDQVFAASSGVVGLSYWFDLYFDYKVSMPLAEYSIPSLQDPAYEHGKQISIRRNGQIF